MLKYTGGRDGGSIYDVPARDLRDDEIDALGGELALLQTGLYAKPYVAPVKREQKAQDNDEQE